VRLADPLLAYLGVSRIDVRDTWSLNFLFFEIGMLAIFILFFRNIAEIIYIVCFVFPALLFLAVIENNENKPYAFVSPTQTIRQKVWLILVMCVGAWAVGHIFYAGYGPKDIVTAFIEGMIWALVVYRVKNFNPAIAAQTIGNLAIFLSS